MKAGKGTKRRKDKYKYLNQIFIYYFFISISIKS